MFGGFLNFCETCQIVLNSATQATAHFKGKMHLAKSGQLRGGGGGGRGGMGRGAPSSANGAGAPPLRSILKPTWEANAGGPQAQKRSLPAEAVTSLEKKSRVAGDGSQHTKNSVALLNEYKPGIEFLVVGQSGEPHAPVFTMRVEIDGRTYEASGSNKKKAKNDLADQVVEELSPQIEAALKLREEERRELEQAENEYYEKIKPKKREEEPGEGQMICEDVKIDNWIRRPKTAIRVMMELSLRPRYSNALEEMQCDDGSTGYVVTVEVQGSVFEGHGKTPVLAKALAAAEALNKLYNVDFEYADNGHPMYAGDPNQYKALKNLLADPTAVEKPVVESSRKDQQPVSEAPPPPTVTITIDGKNPVMILNELFVTAVSYETVESPPAEDGTRMFCIRAHVEGMSFDGTGTNLKQAKQDAALTALQQLKAAGILEQRVTEREIAAKSKERKPGQKAFKNPYPWVYQSEAIPIKVAAAGTDGAVATPNALAKLNLHYPGTQYTLTESSTDMLDPWFRFNVQVENRTFQGFGRSKKAARTDAAENALRKLNMWTWEDEEAKRKVVAAQREAAASVAERYNEERQAWVSEYGGFGSSNWAQTTGYMGGGGNSYGVSSGGYGYSGAGGRGGTAGRGRAGSRGGSLGRGGRGTGRGSSGAQVRQDYGGLSFGSMASTPGRGGQRRGVGGTRGATGRGAANSAYSPAVLSKLTSLAYGGGVYDSLNGSYGMDFSNQNTFYDQSSVGFGGGYDSTGAMQMGGYGSTGSYGALSSSVGQGGMGSVGSGRGARSRGRSTAVAVPRGRGATAAHPGAQLGAHPGAQLGAQPGMCMVTTYTETVNPDGSITRHVQQQRGPQGAVTPAAAGPARGGGAASSKKFTTDDFDYSQGATSGFQSFGADSGWGSAGDDQYAVGGYEFTGGAVGGGNYAAMGGGNYAAMGDGSYAAMGGGNFGDSSFFGATGGWQ